MKKSIAILTILILSVTCTPDLKEGVIETKISRGKYDDGEKRCYFELPNKSNFYAPCDCYDIGDSTNKYVRFYEKAHR